jgi:hypothetical protein
VPAAPALICSATSSKVESAPAEFFDFETTLDGIVEACQAMNERRAIKSQIRMTAS